MSPGALGLGLLAAGAVARACGWIGAFGFDALFALAMALTAAGLLRRLGVPGAAIWGWGIAAGALAAAALLPGVRLAPYLAIALINLCVGAVFALGFLPGRTPVLLQLIALMNLAPLEPAGFRRFAGGQCALWAVSSLLLGLCGAAAMLVPASRPLLDPVLGGVLLGQAGLFVLSHHYAAWRYRRPETWNLTLRTLARPATWAELRL